MAKSFKVLKILSWNIRQGGGTRIPKIISFLNETSASILVLSEYKNNKSGIQLRIGLLRIGYIYQQNSAAPSDVNSVLIASKFPFNSFLFPQSDPNFPHAIVKAEFNAFDLYGMYVPHKKKHILFDFLLSHLNPDHPIVLKGDFNTGKNYIDQKGNSFWYTDKLRKLEESGFSDAFRHFHHDAKEYSWYSHQGNGYRYDHSYVSESLLPMIKACYYIHEARVEGISDHSPMVLELG